VVCATADPAAAQPTCSYGNFRGWVVFEDANNNWQHDDDEAVIERHDLVHESVTVLNDEDGVVSYAPTGFANPPTGALSPSRNVVICDERGHVQNGANSTARAVFISETGRSRASKLADDVEDAISAAGACPS